MTQYQVKISDRASQKLKDIHNYIANELQMPPYAQAQVDRLEEAIMKLDILPERCKVWNPSHGMAETSENCWRITTLSFISSKEGKSSLLTFFTAVRILKVIWSRDIETAHMSKTAYITHL